MMRFSVQWGLFSMLMAVLLVMQPCLLDIIAASGAGRGVANVLFSCAWVTLLVGTLVVRRQRSD